MVLDMFPTGMPPRMFWDGLAPGTWLIFGIVLLPVYTAIIGWFLGVPRNPKKALMGLGYLIGFIIGLWLPAFIGTVIMWLIFFRGF